MVWCTNCHSPLALEGKNPDEEKNRVLSEEGVSCIACHVRENQILANKEIQNPREHNFILNKKLKDSEFCSNCHQFNFPSADKKQGFQFSNLPMQNTYEEWKESYFYKKKENCQSCHMPTKINSKGEKYRSHTFYGGHNKEFLASTFNLKLIQEDQNLFKVELQAKRLGHSFPTGDLFRKLNIQILDKNFKKLYEFDLGYEYSKNPNPKLEDAEKILSAKEVFLPPLVSENSVYLKNIYNSELKKARYYRMKMKYVDEKSLLIDEYTENVELIFKKGKF